MFFGGKKKKVKDANDATKNQVLNLIQSVISNCRDSNTAGMLNDLRRELESQGSCETEKGLAYLQQTVQMLNEANTYIVNREFAPAGNRIDKAKSILASRRTECTAGGELTKRDAASARKAEKILGKVKVDKIEESRADELKLELSRAVAERAKREAELKSLFERINAGDWEAQALWDAAEDMLNGVENRIRNIQHELGEETFRSTMKQIVEQQKEFQGKRTISDDQYDVMREQFQQNQQNMAEEQESLQRDREMLRGSNAAGNSFMNSSRFQQMSGNAGAGAGANSFMNSPRFQQMSAGNGAGASAGFGGGAAANRGFGAVSGNRADHSRQLSEIKRAQAALENSQDAYNEKLDDANDELRTLNNQLKPLLLKRRDASPSDCMVLDGQIDQLNAKRNGVQHKIRRYRQALSELAEKMLLMDKFQTQKDLELTEAHLNQITGGQFQDFESIAMYLKEAVKKSNEQLEDIGAANAVADSEEINMNSYSGANAVYSDTAGGKDEDKYSALEADLGLSY